MRTEYRIKVPREIAMKRVISVCTTDIAWSVVAVLYSAERNMDRQSSYLYYTILNLTNIEFSMTLKDISKFERLSAISINVIENKQVLLLRLMTCGQ